MLCRRKDGAGGVRHCGAVIFIPTETTFCVQCCVAQMFRGSQHSSQRQRAFYRKVYTFLPRTGVWVTNMQYNQHRLHAPHLLCVQVAPPLWTILASINVVCLLSHRRCFCSVSSLLCTCSGPNIRGGILFVFARCGIPCLLFVDMTREAVLLTLSFFFPFLSPARVTCV